MAFHFAEARDGCEQIVFDDDENLVRRAACRMSAREQYLRGAVSFPAAQIFKMQEGFELIVECGYFRGSDIRRKRQNQPIPFHCEGGETRLQRDAELPWPDAIADQDTGHEGNG